MPRYQLSVHAEKLRKSFFRTPDPYAVVTIAGGPLSGTEVGRTETISNALNPDWTTLLYIETDASVNMPLTVAIWDDRGGGEDRLLGEAQFEATTIFQSPGRIQKQSLAGGGSVSACMEESVKGTDTGFFTLHLRGLDIENVEPGLFGLGRSDPFFEIAKKDADHTAGVVRWNVIYRSEYINNHLNPYWEPKTLTLEELCYCDLSWPLQISVRDNNKNGKHIEIGQFEASVKMLMERVAVQGNADRDMAIPLSRTGATKGLVVVLKADIQ